VSVSSLVVILADKMLKLPLVAQTGGARATS
jgi:hypothetical protein